MVFLMESWKDWQGWDKRKSHKMRLLSVTSQLAEAGRASGEYYWAIWVDLFWSGVCGFGNTASPEEGDTKRRSVVRDLIFPCIAGEPAQWLTIGNKVQTVLCKSWARWILWHQKNSMPLKKKPFNECLLKFKSKFIPATLGPLFKSLSMNTEASSHCL